MSLLACGVHKHPQMVAMLGKTVGSQCLQKEEESTPLRIDKPDCVNAILHAAKNIRLGCKIWPATSTNPMCVDMTAPTQPTFCKDST
jgi:hypothetical protein